MRVYVGVRLGIFVLPQFQSILLVLAGRGLVFVLVICASAIKWGYRLVSEVQSRLVSVRWVIWQRGFINSGPAAFRWMMDGLKTRPNASREPGWGTNHQSESRKYAIQPDAHGWGGVSLIYLRVAKFEVQLKYSGKFFDHVFNILGHMVWFIFAFLGCAFFFQQQHTAVHHQS